MINNSPTVSVKEDGTVEYQLEPAAHFRAGASRLSTDTWTLVDTETDGLWAPIFVVEIAAQKFQGLTPIGEPFRVFINHGIEIPAVATAVHGYTTEFIKINGISPNEAYAAFRAYVGDSYIASHYLIFDWDRVLVPELQRLGEPSIGRRGFCTWFLSRRTLPEFKTHKLDYLREVFTLNCSSPHTAKGDVEAVVDLLCRVVFPRLSLAGFTDVYSIADFSVLTPLAKCRERMQGFPIGIEYKEVPYERVFTEYQLNQKQRATEQKEQEKLRDHAYGLLNGSASYPKLLLDCRMLEDTPDVCFQDEKFMFTGTMVWGSRSKAEKEITARGGTMFKTKAMKEIDYLVLGEDPEKGWLSRDSGSKLADAFVMKIMSPDGKLKIIRERDFLAAL